MSSTGEDQYRMQQLSLQGGTTKQPGVSTLISKGYALMLYKPIEPVKLSALENLYNTAYLQFKNDAAKTCDMVGGMSSEHTNASTAALIVVANSMLNLDEVVTRN